MNSETKTVETFDLPPEHPAWAEYDHAAEDLAKRGSKGGIGEPLPANMTPDAVALINADPEAFQDRVRGFAYAQAMTRPAAPARPWYSPRQQS